MQDRYVYAHLHTPWCDLPIRVGDPLNLLAPLDSFEGRLHALLNLERGLLVLHPDLLLSGGWAGRAGRGGWGGGGQW
jgi:hypothetical protein